MLALALAAAVAAGPAPRPTISPDFIPFPAKRTAEMRAYTRRHYGLGTAVLRNPKVIVEHITATNSYPGVWNTFARDVADPELHELPATCTHFVIDAAGTIHQLVSIKRMCRHTVGLNYTAIGIEHVGLRDSDLMGNARQLAASLRLTGWLQGRLRIATRNVIGHNESLSSPYHRENVARLRRQTHGDMQHATMVRYRRLLAG